MSTYKAKKQQDKYDFLVKVVIIGDSAVGKTNILLRFVNQQYKMTHITTIGVDFKIKTLNVDGTRIKMQIWDTAGQQRFKTMTETYYKGSAGIILVYSVTDRKSFGNIENWLKQINQRNVDEVSKVIVGNKVDCGEEERQVSKKEGEELAAKYGISHFETSAKENINILEVFKKLAESMRGRLKEGDKAENKGNLVLDKNATGAASGKKEGGKNNCC